MSRLLPSSPPERRTRRRRCERGTVTVQMVVLMPALFSLMFLGMQAALYHHGRTLALAAAQEGARTAGGEGQSVASGLDTARRFVHDAGGGDVLEGTRIQVRRTFTTVTVTVTGKSLSVIPGWHVVVTQSATAPIERTTDG